MNNVTQARGTDAAASETESASAEGAKANATEAVLIVIKAATAEAEERSEEAVSGFLQHEPIPTLHVASAKRALAAA